MNKLPCKALTDPSPKLVKGLQGRPSPKLTNRALGQDKAAFRDWIRRQINHVAAIDRKVGGIVVQSRVDGPEIYSYGPIYLWPV